MSVQPGEGGQKFIVSSSDKIKEVRALLDSYHSDAIISVDGGITNETKNQCQECDILTVGSYITKSENFQQQIDNLR